MSDNPMPKEELETGEAYILRLLGRIAELENEIRRLEGLVYVPGILRCAKCTCTVQSTLMNAATGAMRANDKAMRCPNECGPMWRVTERDAGNFLADRINDVRNLTLDQVVRLVRSYVKSPTATVVHFLGKVDADVREAELRPKREAAEEIAKLVENLKGPA